MGGAEVLSIIGSADARGGCTLEITDICLAGTISAPAQMNYAMRHRRNRQGRQATDAAAAARSERKAAKLRLQSFGRTSRPSASRPASVIRTLVRSMNLPPTWTLSCVWIASPSSTKALIIGTPKRLAIRSDRFAPF
jgi:hypothetical protein